MTSGREPARTGLFLYCSTHRNVLLGIAKITKRRMHAIIDLLLYNEYIWDLAIF
jgi:hypothetical protein